jgi:hypothetical protein
MPLSSSESSAWSGTTEQSAPVSRYDSIVPTESVFRSDGKIPVVYGYTVSSHTVIPHSLVREKVVGVAFQVQRGGGARKPHTV